MHVKRAFNTFADHMGQLARDLGHDVALYDVPSDMLALYSSPAPMGGHFFTIPIVHTDEELGQAPCTVCGDVGSPESTLLCDLCGQPQHV